jgi:hypothetical protein
MRRVAEPQAQVERLTRLLEQQQRAGKRQKIALVATAHYLVRVMWALLRRGTVWEERVAATK